MKNKISVLIIAGFLPMFGSLVAQDKEPASLAKNVVTGQYSQDMRETGICFSAVVLDDIRMYRGDMAKDFSQVLGGIGFLYGKNIRDHFYLENQLEADFYSPIIALGTITEDLTYKHAVGSSAMSFVGTAGYGVSVPTIFLNDILRLDCGTINLAAGIEIGLSTDRYLRIEVSYKRFRVYNEGDKDFNTASSIGVRIGIITLYSEPVN